MSIDTLSYILERINQTPAKGRTKLIAIDGRGGSGKSSLAKLLLEASPDFQLLSVDAFPCLPTEHPFDPSGTQTHINWKRLLDEALLPLIHGEDANFIRTPWWRGQAIGPSETVRAGGTVIVEGCYSLLRHLRDRYDLTIWVECQVETAIENAIKRDGEEIRKIWTDVYAKNEELYIQNHRPIDTADVLLINSGTDRYELNRCLTPRR